MQADTIGLHARRSPAKAALIMGSTGRVTTYAQLDAVSNQGARLFRALGLKTGDPVAICIENGVEFFNVAWAAMRAGLIVVPISTKLTAGEIAFIVHDSGARVVVSSSGIGDACERLPEVLSDVTLLFIGTPPAGGESFELRCDPLPRTQLVDESVGSEMLYSSGTTGRPKGIRYIKTADRAGSLSSALIPVLRKFGFDENTVYLSPAPLYHSAPFCWSIGVLRLGGTVVVMERFDAEQALALIERHRITFSQWVPTHFVRMLKLPDDVRQRHDLSSLKLALHAAAPCPVPVKHAMIEWWGPILLEYFGSSEQAALTTIDSRDWLKHPGSVGRCASGKLHICDENGEPVPTGTIGEVYSEGGMQFEYNNDPGKTAQSRNRHGWTTVGDIGYLDPEGYLFLTDRKHFMIISGGVNVYPQEIENLLVMHPKIVDVAVIGTPDPDLGEQVTAIIQPVDMSDATPQFAAELKQWMRRSLSGVKLPKRIEFRSELPRLPTGKMAKHVLRAQYS
jgi:long-chain acyl-CoA synthetase